MNIADELIGAGWPLEFRWERSGIELVRGEANIERAITIILNTIPGERPMRPTFGCRIHELAFAPLNRATIAEARHHVADALAMWEPRIEVIEVEGIEFYEPLAVGGEDVPCLLIKISYRINATHDERTLVYPFYSIPVEA